MRRRDIFIVTLLCSVLLGSGSVLATTPKPNEKAAKYYEILRKRPESGYLFDRFYNAWLETASLDELKGFLTAESAQSTDTGATVLLALFCEKEGDDVQALGLYTKALTKSPGSAEIIYRKASLEAYTLNFEAAILDLTEALEGNPDDALRAKISKLLGKVYLRNDQQDKALATWRALLAATGSDPDVKEDLIELQLEEGLFDEAAAGCKELITATKNNYKAMMFQLRLGDIYHRAGKKAEALAAYRKSLDKVGSDSWLEQEVLSQIEQVFRAEDDIAGLSKHYLELLKVYPRRIGVMKRHSRVLLQAGETDKALAKFLEVVRLTPGDRGNKEQYLSLLVQAKKYAEALTAAEELTKQYPADREILVRLARIQHTAGKSDEAKQTVLAYLAKSDKSELEYLRASRMLVTFGHKAEATGLYDELVKAHPDSLDAGEARANHLYSVDRGVEAKEALLALAKEATVDSTIRLSRQLSVHKDHQAAYDLLRQRKSEFESDFRFLARLSQAAAVLDKSEEVLDCALARLALVKELSQLDSTLGEILYAAKKLKKTDELAEQLAASGDATESQQCALVELLDRSGRLDQADQALGEGLKKYPQSVLLHGQAYRLARRRNNWSGAMAALRRLIELRPARRTSLLRSLVQIAVNAGQKSKALQWTAEWKKLSPNSHLPYVAEAGIHRRDNEMDLAIKVLRTASMKFPDNDEVLRQLADYHTMASQYGAAIRVYWRLLERSKDLSQRLGIVSQLARTAEMHGKTDGLLRHFQTRMKTNPTSVFPPLALATIHRQLGNYEGRRKYLLKAADMRSDDVDLLHEIARIEEEEDQYQHALSTLNRAAMIDKTPRTKQKLVRLYFRAGEEEKGYQLLTELVNQSLSDANTIESMADTLMATDQFDKADELLVTMLPRFAKNYRLAFLHAVAMEESERTAESIAAFLDLLDVKDEIPARRSRRSTDPRSRQIHSYVSRMAGVMPPDVLDFLSLNYFQHRVYSYRQGNRYAMSFRGGSRGATVSLPTSVDELANFALVHLASLSQDMDDAERGELVRALQSRGIDRADLKLIVLGYQGFNIGIWNDAHEKYPDDQVVTTMWLLMNMNRGGVPADELRKAFTQFRDDWPQLAAMFVLSSTAQGVEDEKLLLEAMDLLGTVEKPSPFVVQRLVYGLARSLADPDGVSPKIRTKLNTLLLDLYKRSARNQSSSYLFMFVASALSQNDDYKGLIDTIEGEIDRGAGSGSGRAMPMFYPGQRGGELIELLTFPPSQIPGLPQNVLALFNEETSGFFGGLSQLDIKPKKLMSQLESVKTPALKILLLSACDKDQEVVVMIDAMLAAEKPKLGNLLLAASWKAREEKHAEVVKILRKARYLPMSQANRRHIEGAIVAHAMELQEANHAMREVARKTALRLRHMQLASDQREQLAEIFVNLGLDKEAEKLAKTGTPSPTSMRLRSFRSSPSSRDKVSKLLAKGEKTKAVQHMAREYRRLFRGVLQANTGSNPYELKQTFEQIRSGGLTDAFLLQVCPQADRENARKLVELAYACEHLLYKDKARKHYEKVLTLKPESWFAKFRLAILLDQSESDKATEYLKSAAEKKPEVVCPALLGEMDHNTPLAQKLDRIEMLMSVLPALTDNRRGAVHLRQYNWLDQLRNAAEQGSWGGEHFAGIFDQDDEKNQLLMVVETASAPASRPAAPKILVRRLTIYRKLLDTLLDMPEAADNAFASKVNLVKFYGGDANALFADAKAVILGPDKGQLSRSISRRGYSNYGSDAIESISPEAYLSSYSVKHGREEELDAFIAELTSAKLRPRKERIEQFRKLCKAEGEEFIAVVRDSLKKARRVGPYNVQSKDMGQVLWIWREHKKEVSLTPVILEMLAKNVKSRGPAMMSSGAMVKWGWMLFKHSGRQEGLAFIDEVAGILFKKGAKGRATSQPSRRSRRSSPFGRNQDQMRVMLFDQLLNELKDEDKTLFWPLMARAAKIPALWEEGSRARHEFSLDNLQYNNEPMEWESFKEAPFVRDLDEFDVILMPSGRSALEIVIAETREQATSFGRHYRHSPEKKDPNVLTKLNAVEAKTFGMNLLILLLESKSQQAVFEFLGSHAEAIGKLEDDKRKGLILAIRGTLVLQGKTVTVEGDKAKAFLAIYEQVIDSSDNRPDGLDVLIKRRARQNAYEYPRYAARLIANMVRYDANEASQMLRHAAKKIHKLGRRGGPYGGNSLWQIRQLVKNILETNNELPAIKLIIQQSVAKNDALLVIISQEIPNAIREQFTRARDRAKSELKGKVNKDDLELAACKKVVAKFMKVFGNVPTSTLRRSVLDLKLSRIQKEDLSAWVKQQPKENSWILKDMDAWLDLELARYVDKDGSISDRRRSIESLDKLPESFVSFYADLLDDANKSPYWKLAMYQQIADLKSSPQVYELALPAVRALLETDAEMLQGMNIMGLAKLSNLAWRMNQLEVTEQWREVAEPLCKKWSSAKRSGPLRDAEGAEDQSLSLNMLEMYLRLGDADGARAVLDKTSLKLHEFPQTYAMLLKYDGYGDWIAENVQKGVKMVAAKGYAVMQHPLTPAMRTAADEIIAAIPAADTRYAVDVLYARFPIQSTDATKPGDQKKTEPQPRLKELIAQFSEIEFTDAEFRDKCLMLLPLDEKLKTVIIQICDKEKPLQIMLVDSPNADAHRQRYKAYLRWLLEDGKLDKYREKINAMRPGLAIDDNWRVRNFIGEAYEVAGLHMTYGFRKDKLRWANTPAELLEFGKALHKGVEDMEWRLRGVTATTFLLHFLCGQSDEAIAWRDSIIKQSDQYVIRFDADSCLRLFQAAIKTGHVDVEQAATAFTTMIRTRNKGGFADKLPSNVKKLRRRGIVRKDKQLQALVERTEAILKTFPPDGLEVLKLRTAKKKLSQYIDFAADLISSMAGYDANEAEIMLRHAKEQIQAHTEPNDFQNRFSQLVNSIVAAEDKPAAITLILRNIQTHNGILVEMQDIDMRSSMTQWLRNSIRNVQKELHSKKVDKRERTLATYKKITSDFNEKFPAVHTSQLYRQLLRYSLRKEQLEEFSNWLKQLPVNQSLALRELGVRVDLELAKYVEIKPKEPNQTSAKPQYRKVHLTSLKQLPESFTTFYSDLLCDANLSRYWRLEQYENLANETKRMRNMHGFALQAARLLLELDANQPRPKHLSERLLHAIAWRMTNLPVTDEWRQVAEKLCVRFRAAEQSGDSTGFYDVAYHALSLSMLHMHLMLNDTDGAMALLQRDSLELAQLHSTYIILLKDEGFENWSAANIQKNFMDMAIKSYSQKYVPLTPAMRASADRIVAAMPTEDLQYAADVLYAVFPQTVTSADDGEVSRKTEPQPRLKELSKRFSTIQFADDKLRDKCLLILPYDQLMKEHIVAACENEDPVELALNTSSDASSRRKRYQTYLRLLLEDGKLDECSQKVQAAETSVIATIRKLKNRSSKDLLKSNQAKAFLSQIYMVAATHISSGLDREGNNTPSELIEFGKALHEKCKSRERELRRERGIWDVTIATYLLHFACNQGEQAIAWKKTLSKTSQRQLDGFSIFYCIDMFRTAARSNEIDFEQAAHGLNALMRSRQVKKSSRRRRRKPFNLKALRSSSKRWNDSQLNALIDRTAEILEEHKADQPKRKPGVSKRPVSPEMQPVGF